MTQIKMFPDGPNRGADKIGIGNELFIERDKKEPERLTVYKRDIPLKKVDLRDRVQKRLAVVEMVEMGAVRLRLAEALDISRQSIHNWMETKKHFGLEGLVHSYSAAKSKNLETQRKIHADERATGNKAEILADMRKEKLKEERDRQLELDFSFGPTGCEETVDKSLQPFNEEHGWECTRYAGVFCYLVALQSVWKWFELTVGHFGPAYRIFPVFVLMAARNVRSVKQLKNSRKREAGLALGLGRLPSKPVVWEWFYNASEKKKSSFLLKDFFDFQVRAGLVGFIRWFTDGHLLPYAGSDDVHCGYNTQRRMPEPGRTNMVTCDQRGRVILFDVQEGKGDLKSTILDIGKRYGDELPMCPTMVFDRECYDSAFFYEMVRSGIPFVTWQKNVDKAEMDGIDDELYSTRFRFNGKDYAVFEKEKKFETESDGKKIAFALRRIFVWNMTSGRRTCAIAWSGESKTDAKECAEAILSRWGASENTFKHFKERHPMHYQPGFKLSESKRQEIKNPEIKKKETLLKSLGKKLAGLYKKLAGTSETVNRDGTPRKNSARQRIASEIEATETQARETSERKKHIPERIDVSTLEDYKSFKEIDNEGKNLFDFVTSSVWNARKQMVDWLRDSYDDEREVVDLFYAIANCQGGIKSTTTQVVVELEPLEQPKRRFSQEQLCRKLTSLGAITPTGKSMIIQVAEKSWPTPEIVQK